jgi:Transcriptional regulators of sugar metabolism
MIVNSEQVVLLADHTKFGQNSLVKYADLTEIDLIITGVEIEDEHQTALMDVGVDTELA